MKKILSYLILLQFFFSCKSFILEKKTSNLKVYFIPNRFSTLNKSLSTFNNEYKKYGIYFEVLDKKKLKYFETQLNNLKLQDKGSRNAKRIKLIYNSNQRKDTIYMSYLCQSKSTINRKSFTTNSDFSKFVFKLIKEKYHSGKILYTGEYYLKNKDTMKNRNLTFIQDRINNCNK